MNNRTEKQKFSESIKRKSYELILIASFIVSLIVTFIIYNIDCFYLFIGCVCFGLFNIFILSFSQLLTATSSRDQLRYGLNYHFKGISSEEIIFKGGIRELFLLLGNHDYSLKKQVGEFYVFQSNSILFPRIKLIVGQIDNGFFIQGEHIALSELNESIIDPVHNNTK